MSFEQNGFANGFVTISLVLSDGQQVEVIAPTHEKQKWGRKVGHYYTVFKRTDKTHLLFARWTVTPEEELLSLLPETQNIPNQIADADTLAASVP